MSDFSFLYELETKTGERVLIQAVTGNKMGAMLEHIAKTVNQYGKDNVTVKMLKARLDEDTVIVDPTKMESISTLVTMAVEHYTQKSGELVVETIYPKKPNLVENLRKVLSNPKKAQKLVSELKLPDLEKGDVLLAGKFKNKRCTIDDFHDDENGQPVADTDRGEQKIFKPRIAKLMPGAEEKKEEPVEEK